ncbi:MAG TPA: glycosyltransferase [Bacillota bacterium]|nr:glycosyltransferase [Bacillota bacterium]
MAYMKLNKPISLQKLSLLFLVVTAFFIPMDYCTFAISGFTLVKLSVLLLCLSWVFLKLQEDKIHLPPISFVLVMLLFNVFLICSLFWTSDLAVGLGRAFSITANIALCFILYDLLRTKQAFNWLVTGLLAGGVVSIIFGYLAQSFTGPTVSDVPRFFGGSGEPNEFACMMAILMPLALYQIYTSPATGSKVLATLYFFLALIGIRYSYSRSALVALVPCFAMTVYCVLIHRSLQKILISLVLLAFISFSVYDALSDSFFRERVTSIVTLEDKGAGRLDIWRGGLFELFPAQPITGFGIGSFGMEIYPYVNRNIVAHNVFISFLVELGLVGLGLYLLILSHPIHRFWRLIREGTTTLSDIGVMTSLISSVAAGMFLYLEYKKISWFAIGLAMAVLSNSAFRASGRGAGGSRLNVMHIIYSLEAAGAQQLLVDMLKQGKKGLFNYSVCCIAFGGPLVEDIQKIGIPVFVVGKQKKYQLALIYRLYRLLRQNQVDILVTHMFTANCWGRIAAVLAGTPLIFAVEHGIDSYKKFAHDTVDRVLLLFTNRMIAVADNIKAFLVDKKKLPRQKIMVIKNGIDLDRVTITEEGMDLKAKLGLDRARFTVGVIGRLEKVKGHRTLLEAVGIIIRKRDDIQFVIVGDGREKLNILRYIRDKGLGEWVKVLGVRRDIFSILNLLDIYLMPSYSEGTPIALLEAMACGKPIIATRIEGIQAVINPPDLALLIEPGDVNQLVFSLEYLLDNPVARRQMGARARAELERNWLVTRTVQEYEQLFFQELARLGWADVGVSSGAVMFPR